MLASMVASTFTRRARVKDESTRRHTRVRCRLDAGRVFVLPLLGFVGDDLHVCAGPHRGSGTYYPGTAFLQFLGGEILLGAVVPILILLKKNLRRNPVLRMLALLLVVGGIVAYRWDTNLAGQMVLLTYLPQEISARYTEYFPSAIEFITGAGIVAYGLFAFTIGVRYFKVVDHTAMPREFEPEIPTPEPMTTPAQ